MIRRDIGPSPPEEIALPVKAKPLFLPDVIRWRLAENPDCYSIPREYHVQVDGKFADGVLGEFNGTPRYVAALEGQSPKDALDRPLGGRTGVNGPEDVLN